MQAICLLVLWFPVLRTGTVLIVIVVVVVVRNGAWVGAWIGEFGGTAKVRTAKVRSYCEGAFVLRRCVRMYCEGAFVL